MERIKEFMEALENGDLDLTGSIDTPATVEMTICDFCGKEHPATECNIIDGKTICPDCMEDNTTVCECCGRVTLNDYAFMYGYDCYCEDCYNEHFTTCDDCGEIVPNDETYETANGNYICSNCRYDNYCRCSRCGELFPVDDMCYDDYTDERYCDECWDEVQPDAIRNYSFKPAPIFHGGRSFEKLLFMGIELEIDGGGENGYNARQILDIANARNEHVYCKHDGSLENGFEIVSHPATLEYHTNCFPWADIMQEALSMGYTSHNAGTCGLHVHVSRYALGDTWEAIEDTTAKIVFFVEKHWEKLAKFTRRRLGDLEHWAGRYGIEKNISETYKKAKGDYNRYRAINLQNDYTIEFRIFRGTLKYSTFIATLQLVNEICDYCKVLSLDAIEDATWADFAGGINPEFTALHEYLTKRGIEE